MFSDRLIDAADHEAFVTLLSDKLGTMFDLTFHNLCPNKQPPIFGKSTLKKGIGHFTVVCSVTQPMNGCEAAGDL